MRVLDRLVAGADEDAFDKSTGGVNSRRGGGDGVIKRPGAIGLVRILIRLHPWWDLRHAAVE